MRGYPRNRLIARPSEDRIVTRTTRSRGHTISFEDGGSGLAIVLIPGWTMSAADWRDAGYIDHFASSHRVLAVDPLGNGLSDKPHDPSAYRWPDIAIDVIAVMDAAEVGQAVVWGYSRGAWLAGMVASEFPGRVSGLILMAGGDMSEDLEPGEAPSPVDEAMSRGDFKPLWDKYSFSEEDRLYDAEVNNPIALGAMSIAESRYGVTFHLGRVTAPALVLVGGQNRPVDGRKTADALGCDFHVLPGLDHLATFSRTDLVFPLVDGFLESRGR